MCTQEELLAKAKDDALRLLSFRPRSTEELRSRLLKKKHDKNTIDSVVSLLSKHGLLDDEKFAKLYAMSLIQGKAAGKKQIRFDLRNKGLSPKTVESALEAISDFDEKEVALETAARRYERMKGVAKKTAKQRLYGFLSRRGFSTQSVFYALDKLFKRSGSFSENV